MIQIGNTIFDKVTWYNPKPICNAEPVELASGWVGIKRDWGIANDSYQTDLRLVLTTSEYKQFTDLFGVNGSGIRNSIFALTTDLNLFYPMQPVPSASQCVLLKWDDIGLHASYRANLHEVSMTLLLHNDSLNIPRSSAVPSVLYTGISTLETNYTGENVVTLNYNVSSLDKQHDNRTVRIDYKKLIEPQAKAIQDFIMGNRYKPFVWQASDRFLQKGINISNQINTNVCMLSGEVNREGNNDWSANIVLRIKPL